MATFVKLLVWLMVSRILIASTSGALAEAEALELPPCDDWTDWVTGCGSTRDAMLTAVLGAIPGAPAVVNLLLVSISNIILAWLLISITRGISGS